MAAHSLQGGCSCGRNQYEIVLPPASDPRSAAQVLIGGSADIRRAYASSLPTLLRVPLPWLQSTTYAFFDDERPSDIRRVFTPHTAPHTKRNFCGFCGTSLSFWSEETRNEADFICINLSSLEKPSLDLLETLEILPTADNEDDEVDDLVGTTVVTEQGDGAARTVTRFEQSGSREVRGQPWFEELIETGPLGRLKRRRGGQTSRDGRSFVEWEVIEVGDEDGSETPSKRVMTSNELEGDDVHMRGN